MATDKPEIIDAEVVEIDNLPVAAEPEATHDANPPIEGRDWSTYSRPERRCTAHSSRTGEQCKNVAIKGGKVCRYHGGNAPHVIANARARLQNAADLMARELLGIALTADTESVKLAAIRDALDRAGLKAPAEVVVTPGEPKAWETVFESIGGDGGQLESVAQSDLSYPDREPATAGEHPASSQTQPPTQPDPPRARADAERSAARYAAQPSPAMPPQQPRAASAGRERDAQSRHGARSQPPPAARELHITGMEAIRLANAANAASGVFEEQRAIETPHKRYLRP
ncbi:hypothetical protein [Mycolicibacterium sp. J2]|uniref:hypothetical protein n=1 Tax=Mycolicibacterium sp. J2 TaxID=2993511 RepID=UPI00224A6B1A|nr:hypothetical protein [Mycolicibacterium sp. J2]MCX2713763.1 hypothetical protein [Mycolicibacterium sp. J2]